MLVLINPLFMTNRSAGFFCGAHRRSFLRLRRSNDLSCAELICNDGRQKRCSHIDRTPSGVASDTTRNRSYTECGNTKNKSRPRRPTICVELNFVMRTWHQYLSSGKITNAQESRSVTWKMNQKGPFAPSNRPMLRPSSHRLIKSNVDFV